MSQKEILLITINGEDKPGLTTSITEVLSEYKANILDIGQVFQQIKACYDDIKKIELEFYKRNDINVVLEEDAIDFIMEQIVNRAASKSINSNTVGAKSLNLPSSLKATFPAPPKIQGTLFVECAVKGSPSGVNICSAFP